MTFADFKTALAAAGYDYLSATQQGEYVNDGYQQLCDEDFWPFLETTATGSAPLTVTDLGQIDTVKNTVARRTLTSTTRSWLEDHYADLTLTGSPAFYWVDAGSIVRTYPVGGTLSVRYWKVPAVLTGTDTPVVPTRYHRLLLKYAIKEAASAAGEIETVSRVQGEIDRELQRMRERLLIANRDGTYVQINAGSDDW